MLYRIAGKLAGIKFGDFSQNTVFLNLADLKNYQYMCIVSIVGCGV